MEKKNMTELSLTQSDLARHQIAVEKLPLVDDLGIVPTGDDYYFNMATRFWETFIPRDPETGRPLTKDDNGLGF
jgi:hypothetical protein